MIAPLAANFYQLDVAVVLHYCLPKYFAAILFHQYTHLALRTSAQIDLPRRGYCILQYASDDKTICEILLRGKKNDENYS